MSEDKIDWKEEAEGVIKDVLENVSQIKVSQKLEPALPEEGIYLNLETLESKRYTVKLNKSGFSVVGEEFDNNQFEGKEVNCFETVYALIQSISPLYMLSFAEKLQSKLASIGESAPQ